jgi:hypothetical protein
MDHEWLRWAIGGSVGLALTAVGGLWKLIAMIRAGDQAVTEKVESIAKDFRSALQELEDRRNEMRERLEERFDHKIGAAEERQRDFGDRVLSVLEKVGSALARLESRVGNGDGQPGR